MYPSLTLLATAFSEKQLIHAELPQVALAGRSNVGKSSIVNALAGRKQLAKTSSTPGKTRSINYYALEGNGFVAPPEEGKMALLVDLPGYGYARCSKAERNAWARLLEFYLRETQGLQALALLLDSRLPPQKIDIQLAEMALGMQLPIIPVLTKIDKSKLREREACIRGWEKIIEGFTPVLTSSQTKKGIDTLWESLQTALSFA